MTDLYQSQRAMRNMRRAAMQRIPSFADACQFMLATMSAEIVHCRTQEMRH